MILLQDLPHSSSSMDSVQLALAGLVPSTPSSSLSTLLPSAFTSTVSHSIPSSLFASMTTSQAQAMSSFLSGGQLNGLGQIVPSTVNQTAQPQSTDTPLQTERRSFNELCVVCGDRATGLHYNVASCNGCKTFFRRTIICNRRFKCHKNGNCLFNKDIRCACRACRFQKCINVGMNPKAIQCNRAPIGSSVTPPSSMSIMEQGTFQSFNPSSVMPSSSSRPLTPLSAPSSSSATSPAPLSEDVKAFSVGVAECDEIVADYLNVDNKMNILRCGNHNGGALLDILTKPPAVDSLNTFTPSTPPTQFTSTQKRTEHWLNFELAICIEFMKTHDVFRQLSFFDKCVLIEDTVLALFILNSSHEALLAGRKQLQYPDTTTVQLSEECGNPCDLIDAMYRCSMDKATFVLVRALTFLNSEAYGLSADARTAIECERRKIMHTLGTYQFNRFHKRGPTLLGDSLLLPATALAFGRKLRSNPPALVPLLYITTPMPTQNS